MDPLKGLIRTAEPQGSPTRAIPQLASVGNKAIVAHALEEMAEVGVLDVGVLATAAGAAEMRAAFGDQCGASRLTFIEQPPDIGFVDSLLAAEHFVGGSPVLVHSGVTLLNSALARAREDFLGDGDLDALLIMAPTPEGAGVAELQIEARRVRRLVGACDDRLVGTMLTGAELFGPRLFAAARTEACAGASGDLSSALRALVADGGRVDVHTADQWWAYDGTLENLLEGNRLVLDRIVSDFDLRRMPDARVQGRAVIHPTAIVESTTIRGPVVIGAGARIRAAYIGPYTAIGENVLIDGAEIENSIVLERAQIEYVGRAIEASVVGTDARICRDFALPKALRMWVGDHAFVCVA